MKKYVILFLVVCASCSTAKKTQEALNTGNYESAIQLSLEKLRNNKHKKGNQEYIYMLEEAFAKITARDLERIAFLQKDGNPANLEEIYETYTRLDARQEFIKPLLPLRLLNEGRNARFDIKDYSNQIIASKNNVSEYLYANASARLENAANKFDFRQAYDDFRYINKINPGYKNIQAKIEEAHAKGIDYVKVAMFNDSDKVIPVRLEEDLLNFNTYGINDLWTVYHSNPQANIDYNYTMQLAIKDIQISPERLSEKQLIQEKQIKDGWKYLYDNNGNVVKDSLGNKIKVDKFKTVQCELYRFTQHKAVQVVGNVVFNDNQTQQTINSYPLSSEFVFEHVYANYSGDKRALDDKLMRLTKRRAVPFPSNEQMVYDAGEDIKNRLKNIIKRHRFN
jgi:hypothetical protein